MPPIDAAASVSAYWDARAPAFDAAASHRREPDGWRNVLRDAFEADGPCDVVDLGTGTGACALAAASLGHRVTAVDGSAGMLAVARREAAAAGFAVTFVHALLDGAPLAPASADIVTIRNVLWTLERPADALGLAGRVLRPGGRVVVSDGLWSVSPGDRSRYPDALAARLPFHAGLREVDARALLAAAGFGHARSWQHLFRRDPYPGSVPVFVLSAVRLTANGLADTGRQRQPGR